MVKHFANYSNVIGWQIDNELNCHRNESYSKTDDIAFSKWLEEKYKTIENLNDSWGNRFWSLEFNSFSQITCPHPNPAYPNPSWITDYYLFLSDTIVGFASLQTKIIRKYMPDAFITHNGYFENIDYKKLTSECLDFLSFDSYPAFQERHQRMLGRNVAYRLAQTRSCSDKYLILEQQSGPGGQLSYLLPTPIPGQIRLWTYQDIAHGAAGVLYFRYRTALYGAEQLWYGIYDHDGEENYRSREIRQIASEINRLSGLFLENRPKREVAIYYDYHNVCADKVENFAKTDARFIFCELNKKNIHADLISLNDDFKKYKVIIVPHITVATKELAQKLTKFSKDGGITIISARSGVKDKNVNYRPCKAPGIFSALTGCKAEWFTSLPAHESQSVIYNGKTYGISDYYEMLAPESSEAVGIYTEGFCKGKCAVSKRDNIYYLGFYSNHSADIYLDIIKQYIDYREPISDGIEEVDMGDYTLYLNHGYDTVEYRGYDIIKMEEFDNIPPFGVVLVKREG